MVIAYAEEAIWKILADSGAVGAICGDRIYPNVTPANPTYPLVVYDRIDGPRVRALGGESGLAHPRIQVTCWATSYSAVKALAAAVKTALDDYAGTVDSFVVSDIEFQDDGDMPDISPGNLALRLYGVRQDYIVWHQE